MRTDQYNEEYPRLTPPAVVYSGKAALKKPAIIPLWVKVSAAAASIALLVTLFWLHPSRPELELMAELSPVKPVKMEREQSLRTSGQRAHFTIGKPSGKKKSIEGEPVAPNRPETPMRADLTLLASLPSRPATSLSHFTEGQLLMIDDSMMNFALAETPPTEDMDELSWARKGFQKMTDGRFDNFGDMLTYGWRSVKGEFAQLNESVSDGITTIKNINR